MVFGKVEMNSNTCCNVGNEGQTKYDEKLEKLMQDCIQELGLVGMYFIFHSNRNIVNHFEATARNMKKKSLIFRSTRGETT